MFFFVMKRAALPVEFLKYLEFLYQGVPPSHKYTILMKKPCLKKSFAVFISLVYNNCSLFNVPHSPKHSTSTAFSSKPSPYDSLQGLILYLSGQLAVIHGIRFNLMKVSGTKINMFLMIACRALCRVARMLVIWIIMRKIEVQRHVSYL